VKAPSFIVVFSATLALLLAGICVLLLVAALNVSSYVKSRVRLHVYVERDLSPDSLAQIGRLSQQRLVALGANSATIQLVTKTEAAELLKKETGEDFISFLGSNPLRDYYQIGLDAESITPELLANAKVELAKVPGVFEVTYLRSIVEAINLNIGRVLLVLGAFALLLLLSSTVLVANTVRLSLYAQRQIIQAMQLVGATPAYIQWPYIRSSALLGGVSGFLAAGLTAALYLSSNYQLEGIEQFVKVSTVIIVALGQITVGAILSSTVAWATVRATLQRNNRLLATA
jgi:cell division transport system permease protein